MLFKKNNYKYKQKQTYSLFLLIIPLNVKREVNEELTTAFLFVQFLAMSPCATLGLLTQTYVRTHTQPLMRMCSRLCVAHCQYGWKEVTEFCDGHICWACVWPQSRVCRSTCTNRWCSRSVNSCTDWREVPVLHTHQCLEEIHTGTHP